MTDCIRPLLGVTIPFVIINELPHYCAGSVCRALSISVDTLAERVADEHYRVAPIPIEEGSVTEGVVLTPIGVWTLGLYGVWKDGWYVDRSMCAKVQSWVFRQTKRLSPDAFDRTIHGAAAMMALRPDGDVPPQPSKYSGRLDEWRVLPMRPEYRRTGYDFNACQQSRRSRRQPDRAHLVNTRNTN